MAQKRTLNEIDLLFEELCAKHDNIRYYKNVRMLMVGIGKDWCLCTNLPGALPFLKDPESNLSLVGNEVHISIKTCSFYRINCHLGRGSLESLNRVIYQYVSWDYQIKEVVVEGKNINISKSRYAAHHNEFTILFDKHFIQLVQYINNDKLIFGYRTGPVVRLTNGGLIFGNTVIAADCSKLGPNFKAYKTAASEEYCYLSDGINEVIIIGLTSNIRSYVMRNAGHLTFTEPVHNEVFKIDDIYVCSFNDDRDDLKTVKYKEVFIRSAGASGSRTKPALRDE